jgi:hypothetical protein
MSFDQLFTWPTDQPRHATGTCSDPVESNRPLLKNYGRLTHRQSYRHRVPGQPRFLWIFRQKVRSQYRRKSIFGNVLSPMKRQMETLIHRFGRLYRGKSARLTSLPLVKSAETAKSAAADPALPGAADKRQKRSIFQPPRGIIPPVWPLRLSALRSSGTFRRRNLP